MAGAGDMPAPAMDQRIARVRASRVRAASLRPPLTPGHGSSRRSSDRFPVVLPPRSLCMNPVPELAPSLKQLRLSGILDSLDARNREAIESKLAYTEFLSLLIHDEVARREQKKFALRMRRAAFRSGKSLDGFDFARLPNLNRALIHDLAT